MMQGDPSAQVDHGRPADESLDGFVEAWADALDLDYRRSLEARLAEAVRGALTERLRAECNRFSHPVAPCVEDAVNQTIVELPAILAAYLESARRRLDGASRHGGFRSYLMNAGRNVAFDLAKSSLREQEHLARLPRSHPSKLDRVPTTPSQHEMRSEIRNLLGEELALFEDLDQRILRMRAERTDFSVIGRELGMPRETVRDRYHACAARLRRLVERALGGDPFVSS